MLNYKHITDLHRQLMKKVDLEVVYLFYGMTIIFGATIFLNWILWLIFGIHE